MTAGDAVSCAGLVEIKEGKIAKITNKSCYYTVLPEKFSGFSV